MDGVFTPLLILVGIILLVLVTAKKRFKEGFVTLNQNHVDYVDKAKQKYNPISNLINPQTNPLLPSDYSSSDLKDANTKLRGALAIPSANPSDPSFTLFPGSTSNIVLNDGSSGVADLVKKCEAVTTIDCSRFDDPTFSTNCGMCHEEGKNSKGQQSLGGLYVSEDEKFTAKKLQAKLGKSHTTYFPGVGSCKDARFTTTKAECERMVKVMDCEKKQSYSAEGCIQCLDTETFNYVDLKTVGDLDPSLTLIGSGTVAITKVGDSSFNKITQDLTTKSSPIPLPDLKDGDVLQLQVTGPKGLYIAGYLQGTTITGDFKVDIIRLITSDLISGTKPLFENTIAIDGEDYMKLVPGLRKTSMNLQLQNTFVFIVTTADEAVSCPSTPYVPSEASAKLLEAGVCYKKIKGPDGKKVSQGPGTYTQECLQSIFTSAGCTLEGKAYPSDAKTVHDLLYLGEGNTSNPSNIGTIASSIYAESQVAYTGRDAKGNKLSIQDWNTISLKCTGKSIVSPCSIEGDGPHSADCLAYLWTNKGATDNIPGGEGPTYTSPEFIASLNGQVDNSKPTNRYCTLEGTMSPLNPDGSVNESRIDKWNKLERTDLAWVKGSMDKFHKMANDNTLSDTEREPWVKYCYGITLDEYKASTDAWSGSKKTTRVGTPLEYKTIKDANLTPYICPPGSSSSWGPGRCHKPTFEEAKSLCESLPDCGGITKDHAGYEPRGSSVEKWDGMTSWVLSPNSIPTVVNSTGFDYDLSVLDSSKTGRTKTPFTLKKAQMDAMASADSYAAAALAAIKKEQEAAAAAAAEVARTAAEAAAKQAALDAVNPAKVPLSKFQTMFENAGCKKTLTESDATWWRTQKTLDIVQTDMNTYGSLTRNCTGDSRQTQFCIPGSCKPPAPTPSVAAVVPTPVNTVVSTPAPVAPIPAVPTPAAVIAAAPAVAAAAAAAAPELRKASKTGNVYYVDYNSLYTGIYGPRISIPKDDVPKGIVYISYRKIFKYPKSTFKDVKNLSIFLFEEGKTRTYVHDNINPDMYIQEIALNGISLPYTTTSQYNGKLIYWLSVDISKINISDTPVPMEVILSSPSSNIYMTVMTDTNKNITDASWTWGDVS